MTSQQRILVNTLAQYTRTILNVCLALYSTRIILHALGQTDYGIYMLVAGVVSMLSFVTNALVTTTQRYLSFYQGKGDTAQVYSIFSNSMLLHIAIGLAVFLILALSDWPLVYHVLNIEPERMFTAAIVFVLASLMLFFSIIIAPFRALLFSHENIVYISLIDVFDGILKLLCAFLLLHLTSDRLIAYSVSMLGIQVFNLFALAVYAAVKYEECHLPKLSEFDKSCVRSLASFAGWSVYGSGCVVARNQGIAVILNLFFGTVINAAYGLAMQVAGAVMFVSASIVNAVNPQLMKAEGEGNRKRMIRLAEYESKYSFLFLALLSLPLIFEMDALLNWWLTEVPEYTVEFCQIVLLATLCDQLTIGLTAVNQAIGDIKHFTVWFYSAKLLTLIGIVVCLLLGTNVTIALCSYILVELLDSFLRIPLVKRKADIDVLQFCRNVFLRVIMPVVVVVAVCWSCVTFVSVPYRFLLTLLLSLIAAVPVIWLTTFDSMEKQYIKNYITLRHARVG
ncbi:MAG: hypothetical protein IJS13_09670 [Paludibacteraceae bacterium]|nr:hypothetical protein [Paludibacteraceae bacterium]